MKVNLGANLMRIGTLARRTGVSRRLLRYYEEQGLLRPRRLPNGYREYADSDVTAVRHIRALLAAGLPTAVIAGLLDCVHDDGERLVPAPCPGVAVNLERERRRITDEITRLQSSQRVLDSMLAAMPRPDRPDQRKRPPAGQAAVRPRGQRSPDIHCSPAP